MSTPAITLSRRPPSWLLTGTLLILSLPALWFIQDRARQYLAYNPVSYGDYWPRRGGLIIHVSAGLIAISVGLLQLWLGLTARTQVLHRALGRVYLGAVAVGSAGAFYLALTINPRYFAYATGLFFLAVAWVITTCMAYLAIRRGAIQQHREWMIRSYVVTFAFVSFRLVEKFLLRWQIAADDEIDTVLAWGCWSLPLLVAEPLLQWQKMHRGVNRA
jgi:uncharacterized membrane protein